jgi:DNA mismatch endonuclease (patch repair protein)
MRKVRRRDTQPEIALRSELHRRGFRYFVDRAPLAWSRRKADLVFPRVRLAVFIDGCFWHGCPAHVDWPKSNALWWRAKIAATKARDREIDAALLGAGWHVTRAWEHDDPYEIADQLESLLRSLQ